MAFDPMGRAKRPILLGSVIAIFALANVVWMSSGQQGPDAIDDSFGSLLQIDSAPVPKTLSLELKKKNSTSDSAIKNRGSLDIGIPFQFQMDEAGHLRLSGDIKSIFDMYLTLSHELSIEDVVAKIQSHMERDLIEPALGQAKNILAQYISMKEAMVDVEDQLKTSSYSELSYFEQLKTRKTARDEVRKTYLDTEVYEAFYSEEARHDDYVLSKLSIELDDSLSIEQKRQAISVLNANTDPDLIALRSEATVVQTVETQVASMREEGASPQDVYAFRAAEFGAEAAERFDQLEVERSAWQSRIESFANDMDAITQLPGMSEEDKASQVQQLLASRFDAREQIRVKTLLSMRSQ